jgi:hypothetical protein
MPTTFETLPLPDTVVNKIASRVTVVPEPEYHSSEPDSRSLDPWDIERWTANSAGRSKQQSLMEYVCHYGDGRTVLAVRPAADDVNVLISSSGDPAETQASNIQDLTERIFGELHFAKESEWEEYEEPLWDPMRAEVRSMVREFYEQADADLE